MLPSAEGASRHSKGFEEVAATHTKSVPDILMARERGDGTKVLWVRSDALETILWAEGSDELLT